MSVQNALHSGQLSFHEAMADESSTPCLRCWLCGLTNFCEKDGRLHGKKFTCAVCGSAHRTMRRNCEGLPVELESFTPEEVHEFYRGLQAKKQTQGDLSWVTIKAELIHSVCKKRVSSSRESLIGEWLPLSVWVSRGWEEAVVKKQDKKFNDAYGCDCYQVPISVESWDEVHERVTESLLRQEQNGSKKKGKARDLDVPQEKADKDTGKPKNATAAAQKVVRSNDKAHGVAAKAVGAWAKGLQQLENLEPKVTQLTDMPEGPRKVYESLLEKLRKNVTCAKEVLVAHEKQKSKPLLEKEELPALPFDAGDVKVLQQQITAVLREVRDCLPKRTAQPKGQPKAAPKRGSKRRASPASTGALPEAQAEAADGAEGKKLRRREKSSP